MDLSRCNLTGTSTVHTAKPSCVYTGPSACAHVDWLLPTEYVSSGGLVLDVNEVDGSEGIVGRVERDAEGAWLGCFCCGGEITRADGGVCQPCREDMV